MSSPSVLNTQFGLDMVGGEAQLYTQFIDSYLSEDPFDGAKLQALIAAEKYADAGSYVHRCKGASAQLGAEQLAALGQELEDVLKGKKTGDIPALTAAFLACYEKTVQALRQFRTPL